MTTHVSYRDIPKVEKKRLEEVTYRRSSKLRTVRFAAFFIPFLIYVSFSREVVSADEPFRRLLICLPFVAALSWVIWRLFGRTALRVEVERLKNA